MAATIAFFALLVFGYLYALGKVWRGESEIDPDNAPAFWPFSLPLWRGVGRALPIQGACILVLLGGGITGDLLGEDSAGYDWAMGTGFLGLLGLFLLAFPITYLNKPKFLVPPHQRDERGALEEWRIERERNKRRRRGR